MRRGGTAGITLVELIASLAIIGLIAAAAAGLLRTALQAHAYAQTRQDLYMSAYAIMSHITAGLRTTSHVMVPNGHAPNRPLLIYSANLNQDNDFYRNDPQFPRFDEDLGGDMTNDNAAGVSGVDDNGDGVTDSLLNLGLQNDDEDGGLLLGILAAYVNEDPWDGVDEDADGTVDEDAGPDMNADGRPGIRGVDDDWDGTVDEGNSADDDEDGLVDEDPLDPLIFIYNSGASTLTERLTMSGAATTLSNRVSAFSAVYETPDATHGPRFLITLSLTDGGETVTLSEYVYPRNTVQKTGKRVR